ncbi:MAG: EEP domain-containing protein [Methylotenera sp.]|nr:EEP domain-containing protein [Methylotenera sp.]MSQ00024.1 EEP domain-containing protein [Methylotenera sp.]
MHNTLRIATFNIHKGFTYFNASFSLHLQREMLRKLQANVIFLQEMQDRHTQHTERFVSWPTSGQMAFLADEVWSDYRYGKNSVYPADHHGNALLSKFPITASHKQDISAHDSERRGMLHCEINIPNWDQPLHAICLRLGLFAKWQRQQLLAVATYIEQYVAANAPLIIAGDFNDWGMRAGRGFAECLGLHELFEHHTGKSARNFPAWLPILRLDRIYARGFNVKHVAVHAGPQFLKLSDHVILTASLTKI